MNFQGVVINVSDLDRSIEFYGDVFGFTVLARQDQLVALSAPGCARSQIIILRAYGTSGRSSGGRHIGIRVFVLEVDSVAELERIEQTLGRKKSPVQRLTDDTTWRAVVAQDPDRIAVVVGASLRGEPITDKSWADLHVALYGLGE
jgi:catechol-2,3-dioxygenase